MTIVIFFLVGRDISAEQPPPKMKFVVWALAKCE